MSAVFRSKWERLLGKTDSPIEGIFLDNFCALATNYGFDLASRSKTNQGTIFIWPQKQFGERYRADFMISYPFFGAEYTAIVECDGHNFHEKTKAQAARDKRRDRVCQRLGYKLFRFTGSELHGDPNGCAFEVLDAIMEFQTEQLELNTEPCDPLELDADEHLEAAQ